MPHIKGGTRQFSLSANKPLSCECTIHVSVHGKACTLLLSLYISQTNAQAAAAIVQMLIFTCLHEQQQLRSAGGRRQPLQGEALLV